VSSLLSSYYKLEGKSIVLNMCNVLQDLFIWYNGITQCSFCSAEHKFLKRVVLVS
jgi:hypothetical protein